MMKMAISFATLCVATAAHAAPSLEPHALVLEDQGVRYLKGVPTLDQLRDHGAIQIKFLTWDHGNAVFAVAAYNGSTMPANLGIENVSVQAGGKPLRIFSAAQLAQKAKNRAMWGQIGLALLGGVAAASAANQRSYYSGHLASPYGTYSYYGSYPSLAGQLRANQITTDTAFGIAAIQYRLDATIEAIGERVLQTTTVDPGQFFGGLVFVEKLDSGKAPIDFRMSIDWNGDRFTFGYLFAKRGREVPAEWVPKLAARARPSLSLEKRTLQPTMQQPQTIGNSAAADAPRVQAVYLSSGAVKIPSDTPSGYCLRVPSGYMATGSINAPLITKSMPKCL